MNFGLPVDNAYLKTLPEYKDRNDLTAKDRSDVALQLRDTYSHESKEWLEKQKAAYGVGVVTLCRIYNASGDPITLVKSKSWNGQFFQSQPSETIQNGQWGAFIHGKQPVITSGSVGCVIYHTGSDTDLFIGWRNPYWPGKQNNTWCESQPKDQWWAVGSEDYMDHLLNYGQTDHEHTNVGYKVKSTIGESQAAYCEAIITKV